MRVAVGQAFSRPTIEENAGEAARLLDLAAADGANLLVLSELFTSGYDPRAVGADPKQWAIRLNDPRLDPIRHACRLHSVTLLIGAPALSATGDLVNGVIRVDADGADELVYAKVHLWEQERGVFRSGDSLTMVEIGSVRVGLGVCYDAGFPEFVRAYARAGADLVVFSSAFATGDEEHRYHIYHAARALENGVFVAVANSVGPHGERSFIGRSQIFDPQGRCLVDLGREPGVGSWDVTAEVAARQRLSYLTDLVEALPLTKKGTTDARVRAS